VAAGSKILPIEDISDHPLEKEILLPRTGKFEVTDVHYDNNYQLRIYDIIYLPEKLIEINQTVSLKTIDQQFSNEEWTNRILNMITPYDYLFLSDPDSIIDNVIKTSFSNKSIPLKAIQMALIRLRNTS